LQDGIYNTSGNAINFSANGTESEKIIIRSETPGGVIFTGPKTFADVGGSYQIIHGFHFKDIATDGNWNTNLMKINNSSHNRITNCKFENIGQGGGSTLIGVWYNSPHNRFDHNTWDGNDGVGIETPLRVYEDTSKSTHTQIDHNVFKNHAEDDASEALRLGRGATSAGVNAYMTIEYNLFQEWHGDPEVISVKSSSNIIRYNVVKNCNGGYKLRTGNDNTFEGNYYFLEDDRSHDDYLNAVGLKIKGKRHKVINNYIYRGYKGIVVQGTDADPTYESTVTTLASEQDPYYLVDNTATWNDNEYNGTYVWITSGTGEGKGYYILDTDAANKRLHCKTSKRGDDANLLADGVGPGDSYWIDHETVGDLLLLNNTIIDNKRSGIELPTTSHGSLVINNLVSTDSNSSVNFGYLQHGGSSAIYQTNLFYGINGMGPWSGPVEQPDGILEADPKLKFDGIIYRLQSTSTNAINKGTIYSSVVSDIDGHLRGSSNIDIGADEYSTEVIVRTQITEGIGGAGVQWPQSTLQGDSPNPTPNPPKGLRVLN